MADPDKILESFRAVFKRPGQERRLLEAGWRFQIIGPLVDESLPDHEKARYRGELLGRMLEHPWRGPIVVSARTLRRWCRCYRSKKLPGLVTRPRADHGSMTGLPQGAIEFALELREEDGRRTAPQLIRLMEANKPEWVGKLKRTTLDRHLRARGSVRQRKVTPQGPFRRFEAEAPCELWQGDVLVGPMVLVDGKPTRCRVVCWIDDHSRYLCHIEAYPDEKFASIEDALRKAILKFGTSLRIFVDNAWTYSGPALGLACSELGITRIHSTPRYPVSRGKQERVFSTLRQQFLNEVENLEPMPLEQLNRYLIAWAGRYHQTKHSTTNMTPLERFADRPHRMVPLDRLDQAFWQWDTRAISPTGEIKFSGNRYMVDPTLATRKAIIRYNPNDLGCVHVWKDGHKIATATTQELIHQRRRGQSTPRHTKNSRAAQRFLDQLERAHQERLARELNLTRYPEALEISSQGDEA